MEFRRHKRQERFTSVTSSELLSQNRHEIRNYVMEYKCNTGDEMENTYLAYQHYLKSYLRCVKGVDDNLKRLSTISRRKDSGKIPLSYIQATRV